MSKKSHLAVHISNRKGNTVAVTVIQPRNRLGQFMTPAARAIRSVISSHATLNGEVVRKGYLTR
jgi:hypothetical protein